MAAKDSTDAMNVEELRALVPQLQQITEKYKRAEVVQKALFDISELANSVSELPRLYPAVHEVINKLMPAKNLLVALYEQNSQKIEFVYFVDEFDDYSAVPKDDTELSGGLTGHLLRTGEPLFITQEDYDKQASKNNITDLGTGCVDWIGVPLKRGSQVIGAIVVQSYDESVRYKNADLELLVFVSQHIVNALERVKNRELTERNIRERTRQLRLINQELQEEIRERQKVESLQQALFEISELSATVDGDMASFYTNLHNILARLLNAPNCYIALLNVKGDLHFPYWSDEVNLKVKDRPLGKGLTEYVLHKGQAALIDADKALELSELNELSSSVADAMVKTNNCWLGSPLIVDGEVSGVIALQTYGFDEGYTPRDLELLRFVSHHIAVAMERKRVAETLQQLNQQLAEKVKERTKELYQTNQHLKQQIDERKEIELKLIHDAHHDALTGLPNRVMFASRLELAIEDKKRYTQHNFAVLFIDLDRFKVINDTIGHHAGDLFLVEVANRLGQCIRGHDLLARLGGDEFVVLLDNLEEVEDAEEVAGRIIDKMAQPFLLEDKEMYSGASIGITHLQSWYKSSDEVIRDADAAMYQAKAMGRGRYMTFNSSMRDRLLEELELESEFRQMLANKSFDCYCQPSVDVKTGKWLHLECYVRWLHPTLGKIKRQQIWQVAEQTGLTIDMDNFMLEVAFDSLSKWRNQGGEQLKIALNLSIKHVLQPNIANKLLQQVRASGIKPEQLVLEFDESSLNKGSQQVLPALNKLKEAGVTLVLDNFGSGLASLSYLYSYPFDFVKIDYRFIRTLPKSEKTLKMIQSVISISEHIGFKIVAEGVENDKQFQSLSEIGCHLIQGKYVCKPERLETLCLPTS